MANYKRILVALAVVSLAAISLGQGQGRRRGGYGFGPLQLISRPDVQADLALTDDAKTKVTELTQKMRDEAQQKMQDAGGDRSAFRKIQQDLNTEFLPQLNAILSMEQQTRLKQIGYQLQGFSAIVGMGGEPNQDLVTALGITPEQIEKIKTLQSQANEANQALRQKAQNGEIDRSQVGPTMQKNNEALKAEIGKVLSDEQRSKFTALQGAPFKADPAPEGRPGIA